MKKILKFVPIQLTLFIIIGILLSSFYSFEPIQISYLLIILLICLLFLYLLLRRSNKFLLLFSLVTFFTMVFVGIASVTFKSGLNANSHYTNNNFKADSIYTAEVIINKVLKPNNSYFKYEAEVQSLGFENVSGKILLNIQKDSLKEKLKVDNIVLLKTLFNEVSEPKNPYGFNYKKYLQNQQIYHQITVYSNESLKVIGSKKTFKGYAAKFRERVNKALIKDGFKNNELAVINALLLGQRQTVSKDLLDDYSKAGAIHILAVSGLHIGIILMILTFLFKPLEYLKNGKIVVSIIIIILLWIYALIAGLSPSVVRATTMFTAVTIGMYANKPSNIYNTLFISMFFLLLFHPFYLFEVGFQLSYAAVFSIVWLQPKFANIWKPKFWLLNKGWQLFTVSLAAQFGVAPLSIFYFKQFPGLFFISNLVIIPFLGVLLVLGFLVIVLSLFEILPDFLAKAYQLIIKVLNDFVSWIASQEVFILDNLSISFIVLIATYVAIFFFFKWFENKKYYRIIAFLLTLIIISSVLIFEKYSTKTSNEFVVFHKNKQSVIGIKEGDKFNVYSKDSSIVNLSFIKDYQLKMKPRNNSFIDLVKYYFEFDKHKILVIDSLGLYNFKSIKPTILLLQNSPRINLERVIKMHQPKLIIVDGSNYKSYVKQWELTCIKTKTPFYNTMQKGAFYFMKEN